MRHKENEKLLDDKGQWVSRDDDISHLDQKTVIGFLQDSHYKTKVKKIDRFFPSSKTCSKCGTF